MSGHLLCSESRIVSLLLPAYKSTSHATIHSALDDFTEADSTVWTDSTSNVSVRLLLVAAVPLQHAAPSMLPTTA